MLFAMVITQRNVYYKVLLLWSRWWIYIK